MPTLIKRFETKSNVYKQFKCECGGQYYSNKKYIHLQTIKHNNYLKNIKMNKENFNRVLEEIEMLKTSNVCLSGC